MVDTQKRTRGRPRKFDVEEGVLKAQQLFADRGYDTLGISEICETLGVTPTSLYAAFGNKLGLFSRTIELYASSTGKFVVEALKRANSENEVWEFVLRSAAEAYSSNGSRGCMVLDGALNSQDPEANAIVRAQAEGTEDAIAARIADLGSSDARLASSCILIVMRGLSAAARSGASADKLHAVVDLVLASKR